MIRGYLVSSLGRQRPFVAAELTIPGQSVAGTIEFLVDTGADSTVISPSDASRMRLNAAQLPRASASTGIGGSTPMAVTTATIKLDTRTFNVPMRILAPTSPAQQQALAAIPSLLGRDLLAHFALFFEERTGRVLLLEPQEADALSLP